MKRHEVPAELVGRALHAIAKADDGEWEFTQVDEVRTALAVVLPELDAANRRAEQAEERLAEYENALGWGTSCTSCARVLDSSIREHDRAEQSAQHLEQVRLVVEYWHRKAMEANTGRDPVEAAVAHACATILSALDSAEGAAEVMAALGITEEAR